MSTSAPRRPSTPPSQRWRQPQRRTRQELIEAAWRWQQQTGRVPRYIDWQSLEYPSERGFPLAGPQKWSAEFPAWPAANHVQKVFGSWRHFYVEAGIDGPPPIELSYHERVSIALALKAEGWTWDEVGEHLQLGRDTVRRYANAHPCPGCDRYITARAKTCHACRQREPIWGEPFTRAEILDALRHWNALEGDFPRISDWRAGGRPRWLEECPRYPPVSAVTAEFGSWNAAIVEAGRSEPRHRTYYSDAEMLDELRAFTLEHGQAPTTVTWDRRPNSNLIGRRFGGWAKAVRAANLEPLIHRRRWDEDAEILEGLRALRKRLGRLPGKQDRVGPTGEYPSPFLAAQRFGGFSNALRLAKLLPICPKCGAVGTDQCIDQDGHQRRHPHPARRVAAGTQRPSRYHPSSRPRASKGQNAGRILALIAEQPGISAPEIVKRSGIRRSVVSITIARLRDQRQLVTCANGLRICAGQAPGAS